MRSSLVSSLVLLLCAASAAFGSPEAEALFARRVWPLFQEKCLACHGNDEKKIKADLDMRTPVGLRKGGESGEPSIVAGQPEKSPLYLAVTRVHSADWEPMPPKENDKPT